MQKFTSFKTNKITHVVVFFNNQTKLIYFKKSKSTADKETIVLSYERNFPKNKTNIRRKSNRYKICVWYKSREKMP